MAYTVAGLDFGTTGIKIALMSFSFGKKELNNLYFIPWNNPDNDPDQTEIVEKLIQIREMLPESSLIINRSISAREFFVRYLDFPFSNIKTITNTINFILQDSIPVSVNEIIYDFLPPKHGKTECTVSTAGLKQSTLESIIEEEEMADIASRAICLRPQVLSILAHNNDEEEFEEVKAIIDIGHKSTDLVIIDTDGQQRIRTIAIGGYHITKHLMDKLEISYDKAETLKKIGFAYQGHEIKEELQTLHEQLELALQPLITELNISFKSYKTAVNTEINILQICGGTAQMEGLDKFIQDNIHIQTTMLEIPAQLNEICENSDLEPNSFIAAYALASCGSSTSREGIMNFRKGRYELKGDYGFATGKIKALSLLVIMVSIFLLLNIYSQYSVLNQEEKSIGHKIEEITKETLGKTYDNPKIALSIMMSEINKGGTNKIEGFPEYSLIKHFFNIVKLQSPEDLNVKLKEITLSQHKISLKALTPQFQKVGEFIERLTATPCYSKVQQGPTRPSIDGNNVEFSLSIAVDCSASTQVKAGVKK